MSKQSIAELKEILISALSGELSAERFAVQSSKERFVRQRDDVTDVFQLVCLDGKPGLRVQPNVGIRIESVERIFHQASGFDRKDQKQTLTMGGSIGILQSGDSRDCEFSVSEPSDVPKVAASLVKLFRDFALDYFQKWGELAAIDAELNDRPHDRSRHRALAWFRCSTGIIVARLTKRSDYDQLAATYRALIAADNGGFYAKRFEALLAVLRTTDSTQD